jgi:hypothetical protein
VDQIEATCVRSRANHPDGGDETERSVRAELTVLVCAALAVLAAQIKLPPQTPRRADHANRPPPPPEPKYPGMDVRARWESRLAWSGLACAVVAAVGHLVLPVANPVWIALLGVALLSVPAAAALSLGGSSRKDGDH